MPGSSGVKTTSFNLRLILWEAGITVSNKVLECLILRFMKNKFLCSEAYVIVMIRLHLAHGKNEITTRGPPLVWSPLVRIALV